MSFLLQVRRDTEANWASVNPVLSQGEFGYVLGSQEFKIKVGDGVTAWNSLPFIEFGDKALWGNIGGDITNQTDLMNYLQNIQDDISDEVSARASADQTLTNQYNSLNTSVSNIKEVIPNNATAQNQLADKDFVNSSIASSTANFIGTFNSVAEMEAYIGTLTNNDYAFVKTEDEAGNTLYDRYKWNGSEWLFEYELNNSSFTAEQWASINSKATESKIAQITTNTTNITTLQGQISDKQDTITDLATIRSNATVGKQASDTIESYGNIVTHNISEFATSAQGTKADTAIQGVQINGTDLTKDINNKVNVPVPNYTAGTGIDITNNKISVASLTLVNTATAKNALTLLGNPAEKEDSVNIGYNSKAGMYGGTAVGVGAKTGYNATAVGQLSNADSIQGVAIGFYSNTNTYSTAIGSYATAGGQYSTAIGRYARVQNGVNYSIQLGQGTNTEASTLYIGFNNVNYKLLDGTTGKIPIDRVDLTQITGYDSSVSQTLKHTANGGIEWVND